MKAKQWKNIILLSIITIFLLIFNIIIKDLCILYAESIMASFMIVIIYISIVMFGFRKDKMYRVKKNILYSTLQILIIYFMLIYLAGIYFGYTKIAFSLKPTAIINNIFAPLITFFCLELFRYIIITNNKDNKKRLIIYNVVIGIIELSVTTRTLLFTDVSSAYKSIVEFIIPITIKQVTFSYLCYHGGFKPCITYRIAMVIYTYMIPIQPNFNEILKSILNIILPLIIWNKAAEDVKEEAREKEYIVVEDNRLSNFCYICAFIIMFLVITGISPIGITAIGSESMNPTFDKGAGVITLKVKEDKLKEGDIITYRKENKKIIHRINFIEKVEGETRYYTKGDANSSLDPGYVTYEDINNKILFSIPYIGYPSVLIGELFAK